MKGRAGGRGGGSAAHGVGLSDWVDRPTGVTARADTREQAMTRDITTIGRQRTHARAHTRTDTKSRLIYLVLPQLTRRRCARVTAILVVAKTIISATFPAYTTNPGCVHRALSGVVAKPSQERELRQRSRAHQNTPSRHDVECWCDQACMSMWTNH